MKPAFYAFIFIVAICLENDLYAQQAVSTVVTENGKSYVEYNGLPFLMYGVQMRLDHLGWPSVAKYGIYEEYFQKAKETGFTSVIVPVQWKYIESSEDNYSFSTYMDVLLDLADKYRMPVQIMWYGSNLCSWSTSIPSYVESNHNRFPRLWKDDRYLDYSSKNLKEREAKALHALMEHIAVQDKNHWIMMVQVENEPDHAGPVKLWTDEYLWAQGQRDALVSLMDTLGQVIHNSSLNVVTRVNLTGIPKVIDQGVFQSKGIDIVGIDMYDTNPDTLQKRIEGCDVPGNVPHQPEGGGQYKNLINLILADFDAGGGYMVYELRSIGLKTGQLCMGVFRNTTLEDNLWTERDGKSMVPYSLSGTDPNVENKTSEIREFNILIAKADKKIATSTKEKNAAFNLDDIQASVDETKPVGSYSVRYQSEVGGEAFVMEIEEKQLVLMSLKEGSTFTIPGLPAEFEAYIGYFNSDTVWVQPGKREITNNRVILKANEVALLTRQVFSTGSSILNQKADFPLFP